MTDHVHVWTAVESPPDSTDVYRFHVRYVCAASADCAESLSLLEAV